METKENYISREMVYIGPRLASLMGHEGIPWPMARLEDKVFFLWRITDEMSDKEREIQNNHPDSFINGVAVDVQHFHQSGMVIFLEDRLGVWMEEPVVSGDRAEIPEGFKEVFENEQI